MIWWWPCFTLPQSIILLAARCIRSLQEIDASFLEAQSAMGLLASGGMGIGLGVLDQSLLEQSNSFLTNPLGILQPLINYQVPTHERCMTLRHCTAYQNAFYCWEFVADIYSPNLVCYTLFPSSALLCQDTAILHRPLALPH